MLLTFDVGNSETTIGLFDGDTLRAHWRILSDVPRSVDEVGVLLRGLISGADIPLDAVRGVAIASVVRGMAVHLADACRRWVPVDRIEIFDATSPLPITLAVDEPLTVGPDRPMVIATGGLAELFAPVCSSFDAVDPFLTLSGLAMAFRLVGDL